MTRGEQSCEGKALLFFSLAEVKTDRQTDRWTNNFCERVTRENLPSVGFDNLMFVLDLSFINEGIITYVSLYFHKFTQFSLLYSCSNI